MGLNHVRETPGHRWELPAAAALAVATPLPRAEASNPGTCAKENFRIFSHIGCIRGPIHWDPPQGMVSALHLCASYDLRNKKCAAILRRRCAQAHFSPALRFLLYPIRAHCSITYIETEMFLQPDKPLGQREISFGRRDPVQEHAPAIESN